MKTIKPDKLGLLHRTFEHEGSVQLVITLLVGFFFDRPKALMAEVDLWTLLMAELQGEGGIIDEGNLKVRGEVLVNGSCYVPGGAPAEVSFVRVKLGTVDKRLAVIGDRFWKLGVPTVPAPFTEMPVDYSHAYGGKGYALNPTGKGHAPVKTDLGKIHPLPNIELPDQLIESPGDHPPPAGFGAFDFVWPQRFCKAGTYDTKWLETRAFGYAADMDPTIFNAAPEDQWIEGYFALDEQLVIENMHPERPRLEAQLPGVTTRSFIVKETETGEEVFVEIFMRIDTVRLFPHRELGVLVFRGVTEIREDDADDVLTLLAACEDPAYPRTAAHFQQVIRQRADKEKAALLALKDSDLMPPAEAGWVVLPDKADITEWTAKEDYLGDNLKRKRDKELAAARAKVIAGGLDPADFGLDREPEPEPEIDPDDVDGMIAFFEEQDKRAEREKEAVEQRRAEMEQHARQAFAELGRDYDEMLEQAKKDSSGPPDFSADKHLQWLRSVVATAREGGVPNEEVEAMIADPKLEARLREQERQLRELYKKGAHLQHPYEQLSPEQSDLFRTEIELAHHNEISLEEYDLSGADLSGMSLAGMDLSFAFMESVNLTDTNLEGANLQGAILAHATLRRTNLAGANLEGANLGGATIDESTLAGCRLHSTILMRTKLRNVVFRGASFEQTVLLETEVDGDIDLREVKAPQLIVFQASLRGARFAGADLSKSTFMECNLQGADFSGANLTHAGFVACRMDQAAFRRAVLESCRFVSETTLADADFSFATMPQALLRGLLLVRAKLDGAQADKADFSSADLTEASFLGAAARQAMFVRSDLERADMRSMDLLGAIMQKAKLYGTNLEGSSLFQADLAKIRVDGETNVKDTNMKRARVHPRAKDGPP